MAFAFRPREALTTYRSLAEGDDGFDLIDNLERRILDHEPQSFDEAAVMLEMVGENLAVGGRSDGRDSRALDRVINFILTPA